MSTYSALSLLISGVLNHLLGLVNALQMIVLSSLFTVPVPEYPLVLCITVMKYVNFDIIENREFLDKILRFDQSEPFNPGFLKAGFQSTIFLDELGLLLFFILGFIVLMVIKAVVTLCFKFRMPKTKLQFKLRYILK